MTATAQPLTWTTTPPTVRGWFWWRLRKTHDMGVRWVESASELTWTAGVEWAGPIPEPEERT